MQSKTMNGKINHPDQVCSVKSLRYTGGRAGGMNVLLVQNGRLCFEVLSDCCMDIGQLTHRGMNISFLSANGLSAFRGEFDSVFPGGMLYTCGLDTVGGRALPIHGKIHNIPAQISLVKADENGVEIVGTIRQTSLFGEKLELKRTIRTGANSDRVEIKDVLTNLGYTDAEYCLLYHINMGYPFLSESTKIQAPVLTTVPRTEHAKNSVAEWRNMTEALVQEETVYFHTVEKGEVTVESPSCNKRVIIGYDSSVLPELIEWKSMVKGAYGLGIEPSTSTLDGDFRKKTLKAGESVTLGATITVEELTK